MGCITCNCIGIHIISIMFFIYMDTSCSKQIFCIFDGVGVGVFSGVREGEGFNNQTASHLPSHLN